MTSRAEECERTEQRLRVLARNTSSDVMLTLRARDLQVMLEILDCARDGLRIAQEAHTAKIYECVDLRTKLDRAREAAATPAPVAQKVPDEAAALIREMADDLRVYIAMEYPPDTHDFPSRKRKFDMCMEVVNRAEALLAAAQAQEGK